MALPSDVKPANDPNAPLPGVPPTNPTPEPAPAPEPAPGAEPPAQPAVPPTPPAAPEPVKPAEPVAPAEPPAPVNTGVPFYDNAGNLLQGAGIDPAMALTSINANDGKIDAALHAGS